MTRTLDSIAIRLPRRLLEHPQALHIHRMRAAIWLYLALLARLPTGSDAVSIEPAALDRAMGLPEGTIRSWLGHLRKHRYIALRRAGQSLVVRIRGVRVPPADAAGTPDRFFTVTKLERALGEAENADSLTAALAAHSDSVIKRALAGALAVPANEIRRSRTALFLYLLKRHTHEES